MFLERSGFLLWCSPLVCIAAPIHLLMSCFGASIKFFITMLSKFCLILHVFTGKATLESGRNVFKILSRHFKGAFVTELTSRGVLGLASYAFSVGIAMVTWVWIDDRFKCDSFFLDSGETFCGSASCSASFSPSPFLSLVYTA